MTAAESYIQLPADSTGKKLRARLASILGQSVYTQGMFIADLPSYQVQTTGIALAASKHMLSIWNANGSAQKIRLKGLYLVDLALTAVTGVGVQVDVKWIASEPTGGTSLTAEKRDSDNSDLSNIVLMAGSTITSEGNIINSVGVNNDEILLTGGGGSNYSNNPFIPLLPPNLPDVQPITINPNSGVTVKVITSTVVGTWNMVAVFTVEPTA